MGYYYFRQNNSGGSFDSLDNKIKVHDLIVEADSADEANEIATENGVYFDGCSSGIDCHCCGDRWNEVCERDASKTPQRYGKEIKFDKNNIALDTDIFGGGKAKLIRKNHVDETNIN